MVPYVYISVFLSLHSQTGSMAQAAADPLAVEFTWIDVLTLASGRQNKPKSQQNTLNTHCHRQQQKQDVYLLNLRTQCYF